MGYPVITRLGINQIWYNYWFSDKDYSKNIVQDYNFKKIIKIYLTYGLTMNNNLNIKNYWYKKKIPFTNIYKKKNYFRQFFYKNNIIGIEYYYYLRKKTQEYFSMKIWILKYNNWLVISFKWVKPLKQKSLKNKKMPLIINTYYKSNLSKEKKNRCRVLVMYLNFLKKYKKMYLF